LCLLPDSVLVSLYWI